MTLEAAVEASRTQMVRTARAWLQAATALHHDRLDAAFSRADLGDKASYGRFLLAQAVPHLAVEAALEKGGIGDVVDDWPMRKRADQLLADLRDLGVPPPPAGSTVTFREPPSLLGALYVLEGSRLGGEVLRRSVAPGLPTRFLGHVDSSAWRSLLVALDAQLQSEEQLSQAVGAAIVVFDLFEASGRRHL